MRREHEWPQADEAERSSARVLPLLWVFVGVACLLRFIHLDSDPKFEYWIFYVEDEARWVETARNLALFGDLRLYGISTLHLVLSPLFQALNFVVFKIAGVGFWSARVLSATCGAAIILVCVPLLRRIAPGVPLYIGLVILALEPLTLAVGRTALPEIPSLLFTLLAFVTLCTGRRPLLAAAGGGVLLALAIAMKGTTALMTPVFLLIAAYSGPSGATRVRLLRCVSFLAVLLLPAVLAFAGAVAAGLIPATAAGEVWPILRRSLGVGGLYETLSRFVLPDSEYGNVNLLLLGAWVCSWVVIFRGEYRDSLAGRIYEMSALWAAGWLLVWAPIGYTPARYSVHLVLPLTIHLVAGLGLWRSIGMQRILKEVDSVLGRRAVPTALWLALPTAVLVATPMMTLLHSNGLVEERLAYRLLAMVALTALFGWAAWRRRARGGMARGFILVAVAGGLLQMALEQVGVLLVSPVVLAQYLPLVTLIAIGCVGWYCVAWPGERSTRVPVKTGGAVACLGVLFGLALQNAPELLQPTWSIRDASQETARIFAGASLLQSSGAGALFLETRLPYRDFVPHAARVDGILNFDRGVKPGPEYDKVATYRLAIHPRYHSRSRPLVEDGTAVVDVYRRKGFETSAAVAHDGLIGL